MLNCSRHLLRPLSLSRSMTSLPDWTHVAPKNAPPFWRYDKPIQKSPQDEREYSIIKLQNGLEAILVHDSKADKAAASLDVAVGHLWDPDDMPGLAHFCEHLLFMGTERFPKENEYSEFLAKNSGSSNAYTATSNTNYYFNVSTSALSGALSRFAAFFHSPLFSPSCTSRELSAVDSEHQKNHQSDPWRVFQLNKHLSSAGHVWRKFGSGNRASLSKAAIEMLRTTGSTQTGKTSPVDADGAVEHETRRRLVEWWSKEYCASRMKLCVLGKEPLNELAETVSTLFSPILDRQQDPYPRIETHPFGEREKGTLVSVDTIMNFHALELSFPLEDQESHWRYKPADLISHFVGHEGPGSLHSFLKNRGWITGLSSGSQNLARGIAMFRVTIHLTTEGFKNHREVLLATFKYLSLLRASKLDAFHQTESHILSNIRFRFQEKRRPDDYATYLSERLGHPSVPKDLVLCAPALTWDWVDQDGEKKVKELLQSMTAETGRAVLMAKATEHQVLVQSEIEWEQEPWYGTRYTVTRFDDAFIREVNQFIGLTAQLSEYMQANRPNDNVQLFLPRPNEFIPSRLDVDKRSIAEHTKRPFLIRETALSSLWHKKDDRFWVPKASIIMELRSSVANSSPRNSVMTRLFSDLVKDALTEYTYAAELAGLNYNFAPHITGLYATVSGYNDKLYVLVQHILEKIKGLVVSSERLEIMKEQAKRDWENFSMGQSYTLSDYYTRYLLIEKQWTPQEKLPELSAVTPTMVQEHMKQMLANVHVRLLAHGNLYKEEAIRIAELIESGLGLSTVPQSELDERCLLLPSGSNYVWATDVPNPQQPNSALSYYVHVCPTANQRLRVTAALLSQILSEPAFNVLRTKEQLGYIVSCSQWIMPGSTQRGLRIVVQSEREPTHLEERVEAFLASMKATIRDMPNGEFTEQKQGLQRKWRESDKNLTEEANRFWGHISNGQLDFMRNENDAKLLDEISKAEVLSLFSSQVDPASPTRSKLSIHMRSVKNPGRDTEINLPNAAYINDIKSFKSSLRLSEFAKPLVHWGDLPMPKV